jgi:8-oxo-dGTP pyrophosphatase MutT (NUDIX family)
MAAATRCWADNMTVMDIEFPKEARPVSRVLLSGPGGRLLLLLAQDVPGGHQWWVTPGGGLDDGESFEQAAWRELLKETGIRKVMRAAL